jgi:choline dehydrogenase
MKPEAEGGVVDSLFRVHGIEGLRIVDASIFPRIPGYFVVTSVYMIAEKAADIILQGLADRAAQA